jgi:hypothetical protein
MARKLDVIMMLACLVLVGALAMVAVQYAERQSGTLTHVKAALSLSDNFYAKLRK